MFGHKIIILAFVALFGVSKVVYSTIVRDWFSMELVNRASLFRKRNWNASVPLLSVELDDHFAVPFRVGLTTLINIYTAEGDDWSIMALLTVIMTVIMAVASFILMVVFQYWKLAEVIKEHDQELGSQQ
jgi:predicted Kef-type K+ transport protein